MLVLEFVTFVFLALIPIASADSPFYERAEPYQVSAYHRQPAPYPALNPRFPLRTDCSLPYRHVYTRDAFPEAYPKVKAKFYPTLGFLKSKEVQSFIKYVEENFPELLSAGADLYSAINSAPEASESTPKSPSAQPPPPSPHAQRRDLFIRETYPDPDPYAFGIGGIFKDVLKVGVKESPEYVKAADDMYTTWHHGQEAKKEAKQPQSQP